MGLRDLVHSIPKEREDLEAYVLHNYRHVAEQVKKEQGSKDRLSDAVNESFENYKPFLHGLAQKLDLMGGAGRELGITADLWLAGTGDIIGSLGGKFLDFLANIPEKAYGLVYSVQTGNYMTGIKNILEGLASYIPGLSLVDEGLDRLIRKDMMRDIVSRFEKKEGLYKPWTTRLSEHLKDRYKDVRDRSENVFTPKYQPRLATA